MPSSQHASSPRALRRRIRLLITALFARGSRSPDANLVAATIGMSVRTLQRRLRATGLTYTDIFQQARRAAAQRMLADGRARIAEIARVLGYSDPAHFTRAFRRWTGVTPRDFRSRSADSVDRRGSRRLP